MIELHQRDIDEQRHQIEIWHDALWSGFSEHAKSALLSLRYSADPSIRRRANWVLGRWYASAGQHQVALTFFNEIIRSEPFVYAKATVALSVCYSQLRQPEAIKRLLDDPNFEKPGGFDGLCLRANSIAPLSNGSGSQRLSILNEIYRSYDLTELDTTPTTSELSLQALRCAPVVAKRSFILDDTKPLVSVIIPAYNCAATIKMAIDSLLAQQWPNLEIIVVDDASKDTTGEVVRGLAAQHSCIRFISLPENRGAYHARNTGMRESRGAFVTVHDSDDWSHPAKIRCQVEALLSNEAVEATVSHWTRVDGNFNLLGLWMVGGAFVERNHSSALFRRRVLLQQGYWDEVKASADSEYLWRLQNRLGEHAVQSVLAEVPLSFSLVRTDALTQQAATHVRTMYAGVRRLYREGARWWHSQGGSYLAQGDSPGFPVPEGLKREPLLRYEQIYAVDPSVANDSLPMALQRIAGNMAAGSCAIFVWYASPENSLTEMAPCFFEWCQLNSVHLIHPGMSVSAERFLLTDERQSSHIPDSLPVIKVNGVGYCTAALADGKVDNSPLAELFKALLATGLQPVFD